MKITVDFLQKETQCQLFERLHALESRLGQWEARYDSSLSGWADQLKRMETKLSQRLSSLEHSLRHELQLLKQNYHRGE